MMDGSYFSGVVWSSTVRHQPILKVYRTPSASHRTKPLPEGCCRRSTSSLLSAMSGWCSLLVWRRLAGLSHLRPTTQWPIDPAGHPELEGRALRISSCYCTSGFMAGAPLPCTGIGAGSCTFGGWGGRFSGKLPDTLLDPMNGGAPTAPAARDAGGTGGVSASTRDPRKVVWRSMFGTNPYPEKSAVALYLQTQPYRPPVQKRRLQHPQETPP